jgi:hypothetical protein
MSAVLNALSDQSSFKLDITIATETPHWFFQTSLNIPFHYHSVSTDVGLVQRDPLHEDLEATARRLRAFYPISESRLKQFEHELQKRQPFDIVLCDIAPLGIILAQRWDIPSVLIENFTWPWIYRNYPDPPQAMLDIANQLESIYQQIDLHIQAEPFCDPSANHTADTVNPIARKPRRDAHHIRQQLAFDNSDAPLIMASMGGIPDRYDCIDQLRRLPYQFILAGSHASLERMDNCLLLPHYSTYYHPDLVQAADILVGKLGYSTLAEVIHSKTGFAYLTRPHFPESPILQQYTEEHLPAAHLSQEDFYRGHWAPALEAILERKQRSDYLTPVANGAQQAAARILEVIQ